MNFNVFWEALGGPRVIQNASKNDAKHHQKKNGKTGMQVLARHARFFGWGRGVPSKIPAGSRPGTGKQAPGLQGQGNRPQGYRKPV